MSFYFLHDYHCFIIPKWLLEIFLQPIDTELFINKWNACVRFSLFHKEQKYEPKDVLQVTGGDGMEELWLVLGCTPQAYSP